MEREAEYLTLGMYSHGAFYGATKASCRYPQLTSDLNAFGKHHLPKDARWTSLTVSRNNQMPVRRDLSNSSEPMNHLVGLGQHTDGGLWIHNPQLSEQSQHALPQVRPDGERLARCVPHSAKWCRLIQRRGALRARGQGNAPSRIM